MTTIKTYTNIEQSKKLAEILPIGSVDMWWAWYSSPFNNGYYDDFPIFDKPICNSDESVPCWSLAALLAVFPYYEINNNGVNIQLSVKGEALITEKGECLLDLAVNMIIHLHELKML